MMELLSRDTVNGDRLNNPCRLSRQRLLDPKINKMKKNWKTINSEKGVDLKIFKVRLDTMHNTKTGKTERMTILESTDSVNVVAITKDKKIILAHQYRFGIGYDTKELPGGMIDEGETPLEAGQRELREETGYTGGTWRYLGSVPQNPVFMDSRIHHWLATDVELTEELELDDGEDIEILHLEVKEIVKLMRNGGIEHPHSLSGLWLADIETI